MSWVLLSVVMRPEHSVNAGLMSWWQYEMTRIRHNSEMSHNGRVRPGMCAYPIRHHTGTLVDILQDPQGYSTLQAAPPRHGS